MDPPTAGARRKAEQWMKVAEKLLMAKDLEGCKEFASQALAADPSAPGAGELRAAADVLLAAQRRRIPNGQPEPYSVLGIDPANPASRHPDVVHSSYRRLSLLLNRSIPDRPYSVSVAEAARLVADAWAFLSNSALKSALDNELDAAAAAAARANPAPAPMRQPQPSPRLQQRPIGAAPQPRPSPQQSPIGAAPQPRPSPQQRPIPAAQQPPPLPQPSQVRAAPRPPARATPPPPQLSPLRAAPQPPARAATPPPPPQQSPMQAATQPHPPPQQSPIPAAHLPPQPQQPSPLRADPQPPLPQQPSPLRADPQPPLPQQPSPPRADPQPPAGVAAQPVDSVMAPSPTFWTVCRVCSHMHEYDRLYEACKLKCSSCHQPFVAEAMAEAPPIVPGTDMYYCTWGFFPIGFPGCPGFENLVNKQPQGPDQLNAPWLGANGVVGANGGVQANGGVEVNGGADVQDGTPDSAAEEMPVVLEPTPEPLMRMRVQVTAAPEPVMTTGVEVPAMPEPVMSTRVEMPAAPKPMKTMRVNKVKVGAKKRGRPKGSKNKKKL